MSLRVILTPEAEDDIAEAITWYGRKRNGLSEEFLLCVEEALERIGRHPHGATEVYPGVRRVLLRRFPYGVFYQVTSDLIATIAVYHNSRDPRGWQQRANEPL